MTPEEKTMRDKRRDVLAWERFEQTNPDGARAIMANPGEYGFKKVKRMKRDGSLVDACIRIGERVFPPVEDTKRRIEEFKNKPSVENFVGNRISQGISEDDAIAEYVDKYYKFGE